MRYSRSYVSIFFPMVEILMLFELISISQMLLEMSIFVLFCRFLSVFVWTVQFCPKCRMLTELSNFTQIFKYCLNWSMLSELFIWVLSGSPDIVQFWSRWESVPKIKTFEPLLFYYLRFHPKLYVCIWYYYSSSLINLSIHDYDHHENWNHRWPDLVDSQLID